MTTQRAPQHYSWLVALCLLAFAIAIHHLDREDLWFDEGWTMWTVYDAEPPASGLRARVGYLLGSVADVLSRTASQDVHPPLYYLTLDSWAWFVGDGIFTTRLVSVWWGLIALAATYNVGARLSGRGPALYAVALLGTATLFTYYAREARMYTALMAFSTLATWAYLRWRQEMSRRRALIYGLMMALLLYTHYLGLLVIVAHLVHEGLEIARHNLRPHLARLIRPYLVALLLFAPWLPALYHQIVAHPRGPLGEALPSDWGTIAAWWLFLTSASGGLYALALALGSVWRVRMRGLALCLLWAILPLGALLLVNAAFVPLFQMRYTLLALPAFALLGGFIIYHSRPWFWPRATLAPIGWLALIMAAQVAAYPTLWTDKPPWRAAITEVIAARDDIEPAFTLIPDNSVEAYYNRTLRLRRGITIDLAWRAFSPMEIEDLVAKLESSPSVWGLLPINTIASWDVVAALQRNRSPAWRASVMNMIFYRWDKPPDDRHPLLWQFGDWLAYEGVIGGRWQAKAGEILCIPLPFRALQPLADQYSYGLHLTQGYGTLISQWDEGLGVHAKDASFVKTPCLAIPPDATGPYHLRLAVYDWRTVRRLPVLEVGGDKAQNWWDYMGIGVVDVEANAP